MWIIRQERLCDNINFIVQSDISVPVPLWKTCQMVTSIILHDFTRFFCDSRKNIEYTERNSILLLWSRWVTQTVMFTKGQEILKRDVWSWSTHVWSKGQLISKCLFGIFNSPKKRPKNFDFTTIVLKVELFSFVFWENWRHQKRHFEIN